MINFYLPEFYGNFRLITGLHDLMQERPELFFDNIRIAAAYGCFPGNIWNGGRVITGSATKEEMVYVLSEYNVRGIAVRFTYTNPVLEQWHVLDTYCNLCMQLADNGQNEVLVNAPVLEDFLRKNYPNFKYISSTTRCLNDMDLIRKELEKDYYLVVLDSAYNNTPELFSLEHKDRVELIVNHYCTDNCPRREAHYRAVGRAQLEYDHADFPSCPNIKRSFEEIQKNRSFISADDIFGRYSTAGFNNFKLDGRGFRKEKVMTSFLYYLVKPECREEVRSLIINM